MSDKINLIIMVWMVFRLWLSGVHFVVNFYRRHSSLVLINGDGTANILHSREGVTQGYPLVMVSYGIGIVLLIKGLKFAYPEVTYTWYVETFGALGIFDNLEQYFNSLK